MVGEHTIRASLRQQKATPDLSPLSFSAFPLPDLTAVRAVREELERYSIGYPGIDLQK